ncbi:RadC family protein [Sphingomonas sp. SUN039]|uniref:JAB domain-containing protein n=1 Tax=Sphingomonas sp. SUN039 TaxID=2937787 RepID=UPI0021643D31|nr:JAB domain-containing protein [Sphingomonas sp. SUN039]UVO53047.1 hypothetical protein M0209_02530 [Sphingomonas sp. SUN039]
MEQLLAAAGIPEAEAIARLLIDSFGSLRGALTARPSRLHSAIGKGSAALPFLKLWRQCLLFSQREQLRLPVRCSSEQLVPFLQNRIGQEPIEVAYVILFNATGGLLWDGEIARGSFQHCPAEPKEIARKALEVGAALVVLAHNHPGGDPTPSTADRTLTRRVSDTCRLVDAVLFDHLVIGAQSVTSFRELGLL